MTDDALDEVLLQAEARVGRTLKGKWTLDRLLGVGGMAAVYAATHRNQKRVAIKMLHPELSFNAAVRQRFLREGYVANTVQHPGAVSVDDDDVSEDGCAFLVMELLDGETLDARWSRKHRRLPPGEVLAFIDRVLDTLAAAHARGIVHRDLKPENLFLTRDAQVKVLDFGIARVRELSGATKTQTGSLMGTPTFMPPEQARGRWEEVDAQSDLWAIGATMFTLLSGEFVHVASTVNEALVLAVTQPARSLGALRPELPSALIQFVDRSLAYDKRARWPDATTMQTALREAYAALGSDWDEATVLDDAAASLSEESTIGPGVAASNTTELVTARSHHPHRIATQDRILFLVGGVALAAAVLVFIGVVASRTSHKTVPESPTARAAAMRPTLVPEPARSALATTPADPPPLAIEDLPAVAAKPKRPAIPVASTHSAPTSSLQSPKVGAGTAERPMRSATTTADPFAGRE